MTFNEENTVEQLVLDSCVSLGWKYVSGPELPRQLGDVSVSYTHLTLPTKRIV